MISISSVSKLLSALQKTMQRRNTERIRIEKGRRGCFYGVSGKVS